VAVTGVVAGAIAAVADVTAAVSAAGATSAMALPEGVELSELDGGLSVVTESVPSVRSVALGLWVKTGSRDETPAQAGVSHFLEHLLFKGTERYSAIEISEYFDALGAATNAATGKETTQLYSRFLDEHTERALDLLAEMFLAPTFPDIDSERQVVIEEIAMYEDEPSDRVHDVLADAIYGDAPLGRRILGTAEVIGSVPIPAIREYHQARYVSANMAVSAAGNVDHGELVDLVQRYFRPTTGTVEPSNGDLAASGGRLRFYPKETEQYHICFGAPGISRGDDRRFALNVMDAIFGGSSSSRLFREVREKRGLAYSVGSYSSQFADQGTVAMYVGTREDNVAEACEIIGRELESLRTDGVTADELERAKEHVKGRTVLALESTSSRMSRNGVAVLFDLPILGIDEIIDRIDAVTVEDVAALAAELYAPESISAACIGADEDCFRAAVAPVSESLLA